MTTGAGTGTRRIQGCPVCDLFFCEKDPKSCAALKLVIDEYKARGMQAEASRAEVVIGPSLSTEDWRRPCRVT
jgi:hypothetical protein